MAAATLHALAARRRGEVLSARLSPARTASLLMSSGAAPLAGDALVDTAEDLAAALEHTDWGPARRTRFPLAFESFSARWAHPAGELRTGAPRWSPAG